MSRPDVAATVDGADVRGGQIVAEAHGVYKRYGATQALDEVSIEIRSGQVHGLVGRNGAGKSTLVGVLTGLIVPDAGNVLLCSKPAPGPTEREKWRSLVACVYQKPTVVPTVSVAENVFLGAMPTGRFGMIKWAEAKRRASEALLEWDATIDIERDADGLSVEQRQIVEIVRALLVGARFIILDEPTAGLEGAEITRLFDRIRALQASGVSFLYISHHLDEIFELCQCVTVLRDGQKIVTRDIAGMSKEDLVASMVGASGETPTSSRQASSGSLSQVVGADIPPVLDIKHLTIDKLCHDVNLQVLPGQCIGLAGHAGSGKSEVADSVAGLMPFKHGEIRVSSRPIVPNRPDKAVDIGVGYVPEDRYTRGFVYCLNIIDNVTLPVLHRLGRLGWISLGKQESETRRLIKTLDIKVESPQQEISQLSGGNQQKATLGRALSSDPDDLVLVHPTAGVDVASKMAILRAIDGLRGKASGVLLVSDDEEELRICDRVLVMFKGSIVKEFAPGWQTHDLVMAMEGWAGNDDVQKEATE